MNSFANTIKRLRTCKGDTQEQLAKKLHISSQAVSKWENGAAFPDVLLLPQISDYFGITIDELFEHKLNSYTYKERFIQLMHNSGALILDSDGEYIINTEKFTTNTQILKIGECFADYIRENNIVFDAIMGLAYHGISFSAATAFSLAQKYGVTTYYCYDRKIPDSRNRCICGYTLCDGDRVIIIDDMIGTGAEIDMRIEKLLKNVNVEIAGVIVIADTMSVNNGQCGCDYIREKYSTEVYSLISDDDIMLAIEKHII